MQAHHNEAFINIPQVAVPDPYIREKTEDLYTIPVSIYGAPFYQFCAVEGTRTILSGMEACVCISHFFYLELLNLWLNTIIKI